jgi:hypothetical protein
MKHSKFENIAEAIQILPTRRYKGPHRVIRFLVVIVVVVDRACNPLRVLLSPLLAALGILLGALDDDAGWHHSTIVG